MRATVLDELRQRFRPEFLNRVDEIVVFHKLSEEQLKEIVEIQLNRVRARLRDRRIALEITDDAKTHLVRVGYEPAYGARPLKRAIQREIETPLGRKILAGEVRDGDVVRIGFEPDRGQLTFKVVEPLPRCRPSARNSDGRFRRSHGAGFGRSCLQDDEGPRHLAFVSEDSLLA